MQSRWCQLAQFEVLLGITLTGLCANYVIVSDRALRGTLAQWIWLGFAFASACAGVFWLVALKSQRLRTYASSHAMGVWLLYDFILVVICLVMMAMR